MATLRTPGPPGRGGEGRVASVVRATLPEGIGGNAHASRVPQGAHWKGSGRRDGHACVFPFPKLF